jgi:hypothetical protein
VRTGKPAALKYLVGAEWPLSRKFGCDPKMAVDVLEHAHCCDRFGDAVAEMPSARRVLCRWNGHLYRDGQQRGQLLLPGDRVRAKGGHIEGVDPKSAGPPYGRACPDQELRPTGV